ncbi:MAG TPA: LLM class flavin-dependent oxidoreductase, partial [Microlunatus sp.]|nr:LLM class flavin-dependent oxidoreductase [Microlunatus sp.]
MRAERPFRFGLVAGRTGGARQWAELSRRAEALGFDTLLVPDVVGGPAPMIAAAAAAAATTNLRVGSYVLVAAFRRPRMLAWEASTLHQLSGGRFELGLGAGR